MLCWPHVTDLGVDLQKLLVQGLALAKLPDLSLSLTHVGWIGQRFSDGLSMEFEGKTEVGAVTGSVGLMAVAIGLAASACGGSDGTTAQVAEAAI